MLPQPLWEEVRVEVNNLIHIGRVFALRAAYRLLSFEGNQEAYELQQTLPEDLFPPNRFAEVRQQDPCVTRFSWTEAECELCVKRLELSSEHLACQMKNHCINPSLQVPTDLGDRLASVVDVISIEQVEVSIPRTSDDGLLEDCEPALCAYAPQAIADLTRRIIGQISKRTGMPLRQISLKLHTDDLIFDAEIYDLVYRVWISLLERAESWNDNDKLVEAFLFRAILKAQDAEVQVRHLIQRPESATDLLAFQKSFVSIQNWDFIREQLNLDLSNRIIHRVIWYISANAKEVPQDILNHCAFTLLKHDYFLVRMSVLNLLFQSENLEAIQVMIESDWSWSVGQNFYERHWGCLLLCKYGGSLRWADVHHRIHPIYLGYMVYCRGLEQQELDGYTEEIISVQSHIDEHLEESSFDYSTVFTTASFEADRDIIMPHLISKDEQQSSRSVSFISSDSCWGGVSTDDSSEPFEELFSSGENQRDNQQRIIESIQEQQRSGNFWLGERFFPYSILQIVTKQPDVLNQWLGRAFTDTVENTQFLCCANSFFESLCEVLLQCNPEQGVRLYWRLQQLDAKIRIRDNESKLEVLDYALFKAEPIGLIEKAWEQKLERCLTDRELMRLVVLAESGNGHGWLWSTIENGLQSSSPYENSRSIRLLGFISNREALERLDLLLENVPDTWVKEILEKSRQLWQRNDWSIHWFKRFLELEDNVEAWASFKLFLKCVDTRFWLWQEQVKAESREFPWARRRFQFLEDNRSSIQQNTRSNEKDLDKYLFGHKVSWRQIYPWM
jgi:hypothetical protein